VGPEPLGISWVEADLWNTEAIADGNGPGGLAHATLGVEDLYIPIADDGDWITALLLNDATPSDSLDTRSRYLGVAGASSPPEAEWPHWTEADLFNTPAPADTIEATQQFLGVG